MESGSFLRKAAEGVSWVMDSKRVYGDPVDAHSRTVIPVSTAWWCGGGGGGVAYPEEGGEEEGARKDGSGESHLAEAAALWIAISAGLTTSSHPRYARSYGR